MATESGLWEEGGTAAGHITPTDATEHLVRLPQQERSRKTLERIVRAALDLITEKGVDGASVQAIARRARASVGSFYARFPGKEELLAYIEVQLWADAQARWAEALEDRDWAGLDFEDLVATLVGILVRVNQAGARHRRLLDARRGPESSADVARAFEERLSGDVRELLMRHVDRIDHPQPARAVDLCITMVLGTLRLRDTEGALPSLGELEDEGWADELTRVCLGYLTGAAPPSRGQMDFFDVWG
ncbi:MAG: TetR/AcrR family transcriptional regulator [Gemmatimonadetes bacterium]|nr:TetR/AcrR family transcriptional regulator [Gemmatimonadota bacterium]